MGSRPFSDPIDSSNPTDGSYFGDPPSARRAARLAQNTPPQPDPRIAEIELKRLTAELTIERATSARFRSELDTANLELARIAAIEKSISAKKMGTRDEPVLAQARARRLVPLSSRTVDIPLSSRTVDVPRNHTIGVHLSHTIGNYTSDFVDAKSKSERAALREDIATLTHDIWNRGLGGSWKNTVGMIRVVLGCHGFVFREPGEGRTGWDGYAIKVPNLGVVEQLDRVVRTHRAELDTVGWYLCELEAVLYRIAKYLEMNQ